jgi:membrane protein YqaA with SNARE-associated domain
MEAWLMSSINWLLAALALPEVGLSAICAVAMVSATVLPLGSEPAVFGYLTLAPDMFWPAVLVATAGNTVGGVISYYTGVLAEKGYERWLEKHEHVSIQERRRRSAGRWHVQISNWLRRLGAPALLLSWLPVVGDPLCVVAGWLRLPFWPSVFYMAIGKFLRYALMTSALLWLYQAA